MALFSKEPDKTPKPVAMPKLEPAPVAPIQPAATAPPGPALQAKADGLAGPAETRAFLDRGSRVSGKLFFEGPARIDGNVEGEVTAKDLVVLGETAVVNAQVKAASIVVAGRVNGDLMAGSRLEIRPTARVTGNVSTPVLVVQEGAFFEGHCSMQPEGTREEKKVAIVLKEERTQQAAGLKPA